MSATKAQTSLRSFVRKPASLLLLACLLPLVMLAFCAEKWAIDDAYISYRYAHNFVQGQGLVFNTGERVEGFTSLLWTLMMAVPEAFGLPPHVFAAFLSLCFGLLALVVTWRVCRQLDISLPGSITAVVALGLYPDFWLSIVNGLEGGLFAFLLMCTISLTLSRRLTYAGLCGGLLFMTRPESILVVPVCALYLLLTSGDKAPALKSRPTRHLYYRLVSSLIPWLLLIIAITAWRLAYFGAWLPNSIVAKSVPLSAALNFYTIAKRGYGGVLYIIGFLVSMLPLTLGAALAFVVEKRRPAIWLILALIAIQLTIVLVNGGDWMSYHRLLAVYGPLLAILLGITTDHIVADRRLSDISRLQLMTRVAVGLSLIVGVAYALNDYEWKAKPDIAVKKPEPCWQMLSNRARPVLLATDKVSPEALGIFSYMLPDIYSYDFMGLTDRYVAHHGDVYVPTFGKSDPAYTYYVVRPNLILVHSGFVHLRRMAKASGAAYNYDYLTYVLRKLPDFCPENRVMISIRRDSVARILPAFAELDPQAVTVPSS